MVLFEQDADYFRVVVDHDSDVRDIIESYTGQSAGWQNITLAVPDEYRSFMRIGFVLDSDEGVHAYGAYR